MSRKKKFSTETPVIELGVVAEDIIIEDEPEKITEPVEEPSCNVTIVAKVVFVKNNSVTFEVENHLFEKNVAEANRKYKKGGKIDVLCEGTIGKSDFKLTLI